MFETNKLRGRIIEVFGSQSNFAKAVNRPISFVSMYLNGHKNLDQQSIFKWAKALSIPAGEIDDYFFKLKVHETEP